MKVTRFEGTPEEFRAVADVLFPNTAWTEEGKQSDAKPVVQPKEAIRSMLMRRPISDGQMAVYKALSAGRLEYPDFLLQTGRTAQEMAGVLGALGKRINMTEQIHQAGLPGNTSAVLTWEVESGKEFICLKALALEVLKAEGLV
jgi:hypothetical protein